MHFGIALAGGGTRGAAHVGVLSALMEAGLYPSSIAGTSSGSVVAGLYACGMDIQQMKAIIKELTQYGSRLLDADILGIVGSIPCFLTCKHVRLNGLIKGKKLEKQLCRLTNGATMQDLKIKTVIPAVDIISGSTIAFTNAPHFSTATENVIWKTDMGLCRAIRASCSVPGIFQPVPFEDMCLVDGGVTNVLPVDLLMATGEKTVIAVDLAEEYEMPKPINILSITRHSYSIMNTLLKELTSIGEKILLRPPLPKHAGLLTFEHMQVCMDSAYDYTKKMMPKILKILS